MRYDSYSIDCVADRNEINNKQEKKTHTHTVFKMKTMTHSDCLEVVCRISRYSYGYPNYLNYTNTNNDLTNKKFQSKRIWWKFLMSKSLAQL